MAIINKNTLPTEQLIPGELKKLPPPVVSGWNQPIQFL